MNRRMRNRTSGGVGGRRGNPASYPIYGHCDPIFRDEIYRIAREPLIWNKATL
jgi:hypothetical protein